MEILAAIWYMFQKLSSPLKKNILNSKKGTFLHNYLIYLYSRISIMYSIFYIDIDILLGHLVHIYIPITSTHHIK